MYVGLKQPRGDGERYVTPARAAAKETRWNANRCYSLRTTYLIFETFQSPFPSDSLIFTAVKLFHEVI